MATTVYSPSANIELPAKSVQELAEAQNSNNGSEDDDSKLLERYMYKDNSMLPSAAFELPVMSCPIIDFELLKTEEQLEELRSALTSWGCFQVVNHGMSSSFLDQIRQVIKQFFSQPLEEKRKSARPVNDFEGYGNDTFTSEERVLDWADRLYLLVQPVDKRRMQFWPEKPESLRQTLDQYSHKCEELLERLLKAMAKSLGLEEDISSSSLSCFSKQRGDRGTMSARLTLYPKCPFPERALGIKPHTDGGVLTILLQDKQVEGLQVLKDDQWFRAPVYPDALFINVGDQLEIMSNGIFKSPIHRVVTSAENERTSLVMFCSADPENEIGPVNELITENRPQMYRRVRNYAQIFFKYYQMGLEPLSAVRM